MDLQQYLVNAQELQVDYVVEHLAQILELTCAPKMVAHGAADLIYSACCHEMLKLLITTGKSDQCLLWVKLKITIRQSCLTIVLANRQMPKEQDQTETDRRATNTGHRIGRTQKCEANCSCILAESSGLQ